ncbi:MULTISPECIES: Gfo/Idh/MocA family protein [unclassified Pseudomonas]|uniref:Gfo/Idh/MocA family protein n=1 Tax=unclassified Pseudomonas TaxID=196821 RepID=UPI000FA9949D|nr:MULTISPECIES: Gfo/Idh/MocA family oxidoreductase [unclassified Pseudomonas]
MIRYAVVGAGWISQTAFIPAVNLTGNSKITALVSGSPERASELARKYDIPHVFDYEGYEELVESDLIDAVYIALPNPLHASFAIQAANAGKHVIVEKPIATSLPDADAMISTAKRSGVFLMTSYRLHHDIGTITALDAVRDGRIGDPLFFSAVFSFQSDPENHRLNVEHWGGPLQDIGIYCVNAARHIFNAEPIEVSAMSTRRADDPRFSSLDDSIAVTLKFPDNRMAQFYCSFGAYSVDTYRVVGTHGTLCMDPGFRFETSMAMKLKNAHESEFVSFPHFDHFAGQISYFSECIQVGVEPSPNGEEGLADLEVLFAIERAAASGVPQRLYPKSPRVGPSKGTLRMIEKGVSH